MATRKIRFTLRDWETDLALAFERHCRVELDIIRPLDELIKTQFLNFLVANVDKKEQANGDDAVGVATGNTGSDEVAAQDAAPAAQEEPKAGADPGTDTTGV